MKHFPILPPMLAVTLFGVPAVALATLSIEYDLPPITDTNATQHDFTITYLSPAGIDTATLGDDDVLLGSSSLFDRQLDDKAFNPEYVGFVEANNGRRVTATYRVHRPAEG